MENYDALKSVIAEFDKKQKQNPDPKFQSDVGFSSGYVTCRNETGESFMALIHKTNALLNIVQTNMLEKLHGARRRHEVSMDYLANNYQLGSVGFHFIGERGGHDGEMCLPVQDGDSNVEATSKLNAGGRQIDTTIMLDLNGSAGDLQMKQVIDGSANQVKLADVPLELTPDALREWIMTRIAAIKQAT